MKKIAICMADGVEEIEALTVVDLCRRAGMEIDMISTQNRGRAMGGHGIQFETDLNIKDTDFKEYDGIILPGGGKGTENLMNNMTVLNTVQNFFEAVMSEYVRYQCINGHLAAVALLLWRLLLALLGIFWHILVSSLQFSHLLSCTSLLQ